MLRATWVGFGDEWIRDAFLTVGTALTQLLPASDRRAFWNGVVEAGLASLAKAQAAAPLDAATLQATSEPMT